MSRSARVVILLSAFGLVAGCGGSSTPPRHVPPTAKPTYSVPPASAVVDQGNYRIRPCPQQAPSRGGSWFTAQPIAGKPGAGTFTATSLVDAGAIDVHDGELWDKGGEFLVDQSQSTTFTRVAAGDPHVVLLLVSSGDSQPVVAAVEVRIGSARPLVWRELKSLEGVTSSRQMALAGHAALEGLRHARTLDDAFKDLDATRGWLTPCLRYSVATDVAASPSTAVDVRLPGNTDWSGAVGYDARGKAADVVLPLGLVPWSLLGLPGKAPREAAAVEPTATSAS